MVADSFGHLSLAQVSQETAASLLANQPMTSFALATLDFVVNLHGNDATVVEFGGISLRDENGNPLEIRGTSSTAVYGMDPVAAVPLPATWLLFSVSLAFVEGARRLSAKRGNV